MKCLLLFLIVSGSVSAFSQHIQKEINEQVWKPFMASYNRYDVEGFMALHSRELTRVPRDAGVVLDFEAYKKGNEESAQRDREQGTKRSIELRFSERIANGTSAYEVGIYKVTVGKTGEAPHVFYGKFHVVLRKENGDWKILVDADSSEGNTIGEEDLLKAASME